MPQIPHVTVATVVEHNGKFLMVREKSNGRTVYNQPAGHVEANESLIAAAERETLEETAWHVKVTQLLGIYQYTSEENGVSYVRHCFIAEPIEENTKSPLDEDIIEAVWLEASTIEQKESELRSPLVFQAIRDYLGGVTFPLSLFSQATKPAHNT